MEFAWFIYTIALMVTCSAGFATALMMWVLAGRRDSLAASVGFLLYLLDTGVILFDEYVRVKPLGEAYFDAGLTHPVFQALLNIGILACLWAWVLLRLGVAVEPGRRTVLLLGLAGATAVLAPTGASVGAARTIAYWGFRDCVVMAAFAFVLWRWMGASSEAERGDLARLRVLSGGGLALAAVALGEDVINILFFRPDYSVPWVSELLWHLTERNLSENVLVIWLAVQLVREARRTMRVFARHPTHDQRRLQSEDMRPDFEVRLLSSADERGLSKREREVLSLVLQGRDTQNVASDLTSSLGTVKAHLHRIYSKCGVSSRKELLEGFWRG